MGENPIEILGNSTEAGINLVPVDKKTRELSPKQSDKIQSNVKDYLDNPKNLERLEKPREVG